MTVPPTLPLRGKHVLLVEDILDTGLTTTFALDYLLARGAASRKVCVLIDKTERRRVPVEVHYRGFRLEKGFVVGYGTDHAERYRNLPDIHLLELSPDRSEDR